MYHFYSDEMLLELLCLSGDTKAFGELYDRYRKLLLCLAVKQLDLSADAEELVQDLFLDMWNRRNSLVIRSSLSSYLFAALNYKIINLIVKKKRLLKYVCTVKALPEPVVTNASTQGLDLERLQRSLARLIETLPEKCRLVFALSRDQELTGKQIAKRLGISEKTVEAHLSKAIRNLRAGLPNYSCYVS